MTGLPAVLRGRFPMGSLRPGAVASAPKAPPVAEGFAPPAAYPLATLLSAGHIPRGPKIALDGALADLELHRHALEAGVLAVAHPLVEPVAGEVRVAAGRWWLDGRDAPAAVRVSALDAEQVVLIGPDLAVRLYALQVDSAVDGWVPPSLDLGDPPPLDALLDGSDCAPRVADWLGTLHRTGGLWAVAAVGAVIRLWRPVSAAALLATLAEGGLPAPVLRAEAWAEGLSPAARLEIAQQALLEVDALVALIEQLTGEQPEATLRDLVERRDALASVQAVLAHGDDLAGLDAALDRLDALAVESLSALPPGPPAGADWLAEVSGAEPDAWWAAWGQP